MMFKKIASALMMAGIAAAASTAHATATPTITNQDGALSPFGGFDWASGSVAWTTGFTGATGSSFTLTYAGWAANVLATPSGTLSTPQLDAKPNGTFDPLVIGPFTFPNTYEYTIWATVTETVVGCTLTECQFKVTGGSWDVYYNYKGDGTGGTAVQINNGVGNWTGFQDGTKILSGTFNATSTPQTFTTSGNGSNSTTLDGNVTFTNSTYVTPAMGGTKITSTLQLGSAQTATVNPSKVDAVDVAALKAAGEIVLQADANQSLFTVPEPGALALLGLALTGCGIASRRRKG